MIATQVEASDQHARVHTVLLQDTAWSVAHVSVLSRRAKAASSQLGVEGAARWHGCFSLRSVWQNRCGVRVVMGAPRLFRILIGRC